MARAAHGHEVALVQAFASPLNWRAMVHDLHADPLPPVEAGLTKGMLTCVLVPDILPCCVIATLCCGAPYSLVPTLVLPSVLCTAPLGDQGRTAMLTTDTQGHGRT